MIRRRASRVKDKVDVDDAMPTMDADAKEEVRSDAQIMRVLVVARCFANRELLRPETVQLARNPYVRVCSGAHAWVQQQPGDCIDGADGFLGSFDMRVVAFDQKKYVSTDAWSCLMIKYSLNFSLQCYFVHNAAT